MQAVTGAFVGTAWRSGERGERALGGGGGAADIPPSPREGKVLWDTCLKNQREAGVS